MVMSLYKKAFDSLKKTPFRLLGIVWLGALLDTLGTLLFGVIPGVGLAISALLVVALKNVYLQANRGQEICAKNLFACFENWQTAKRVLLGMGWMWLWILIWGLIPVAGIVFAVIRAYEYRLVPYILFHEPDVKPTDAIKLSRERTMGFKGSMFWADILPSLLLFAVSFVLGLLAAIPFIGGLFGFVSFVVTIASALFFSVFIGLVRASFYDDINEQREKQAGKACSSCGARNPREAGYCSSCGAKFN